MPDRRITLEIVADEERDNDKNSCKEWHFQSKVFEFWHHDATGAFEGVRTWTRVPMIYHVY